jgi:3'-phosphoadenosine 5'-phosphosulfate sulfotransferase (PAPS reductase)/FAD synthetase
MIAVPEDVKAALRRGKDTICAVSVSGGKDSSTVALETVEYLRSINFAGEIILIHSDLGLIEHSQSAEICRQLSEFLQIPLVVVRPLREMIERWVYRWQRIIERFMNLETVRISTPFSSAQNRFCTSEEKTVPICRYLKNAYPGKTILNVVGIRREESKKRALKPISEHNKYGSSVANRLT